MLGFIYIWYDRKHKRYYVGSHWGTENDGYICSSTWMKNSYKRRPSDFRRRIIKTGINDRKLLLHEEDLILQLIKKEELGKKYYNLKNYTISNAWYTDQDKRLSVSEKIGKSNSISQLGKKHSEETKQKMRGIRYPYGPASEETKRKMKENHIGMSGRKHSENAKSKMSKSAKLRPATMQGKKHSEETKKKISDSMKRRFNNGNL